MANKLRSLSDDWDSFRKNVIGPSVPDDRIAPIRDCFYAGAYAMFERTSAIGEMAEEEEACEVLAALEREMKLWQISVSIRNHSKGNH